ncbi:radical SAM/SPASM domain-containing protein [Patescibacteria group bacterium]
MCGISVNNQYQPANCNSGLRHGIIEVTNQCQFQCPGCYVVRRDESEMNLESAILILDLCKEYRSGCELETMDILGGEPLLWPHLQEYIELLLNRGIKPRVITNMLAITPELASWLYERRVYVTGKLNVSHVRSPENLKLQAEMIGRGEEVPPKLFKAIKIVLKAGYQDPLFHLQNLVRKKNLPQVPDFVEYCRWNGIGLDLKLLAPGELIDSDYWDVAPTSQQLADFIRELERTGHEWRHSTARGRDEIIPPEFTNPREKVLMPHLFGSRTFVDNGLYFAVDGSIRSCSNSNVDLANLAVELDPVRKAFQSDLMCHRFNLTQANVGEPCHSCDRWNKCRGGCRATAEGAGDPYGGYPLCPLPHL